MDTRQEEIADAFERHFHHFGYRKTSVDEVARELKISKKTIYASFESKEAIFHYLIRRASEQILRQQTSRLGNLPSYADRLSSLVRQLFTEARQFASERDPLDFEYEIAEQAFREAYRVHLKSLLESGIRAREFRPQPMDILVSILDGLISAALRQVTPGPLSRPIPPELVNTTLDAILRIVR